MFLRRSLRRGATLIEVVILAAIFLVVLAFALPLSVEVVNAAKATMGRYEVVGTVVGHAGSKVSFLAGQSGTFGAQKFSVSLDTNSDGKMDRIVNCTSAQCASLEAGVAVVFSCFEEWHLFTPNEEECRYSSLR